MDHESEINIYTIYNKLHTRNPLKEGYNIYSERISMH